MALFAPNIYILNYLNKTGQLTKEIKSKAIGYLLAGEKHPRSVPHEFSPPCFLIEVGNFQRLEPQIGHWY